MKEYYNFEFGRGAGKRITSGIFTHIYPKDLVERNHYKEAIKLLDPKKTELTIE